MNLPVPQKIIRGSPSQHQRYQIRFQSKRFLQPYTGINLCFIDKNQEAFLHRVSYTPSNPLEIYEFEAPILSNIETILVAPESDTWYLEKVVIHTEGKETYKFQLEPSRESVFVLRTNEFEVPFSPERKKQNDEEYERQKTAILLTSAELTLFGSLTIGLLTDIEKAYAFGLGGSIGTLYAKLLEIGVDNIGKRNIVEYSNQIVRLGTTFIISAGIVAKYQSNIMEDPSTFILGLTGFMMYRLAYILLHIYEERS